MVILGSFNAAEALLDKRSHIYSDKANSTIFRLYVLCFLS